MGRRITNPLDRLCPDGYGKPPVPVGKAASLLAGCWPGKPAILKVNSIAKVTVAFPLKGDRAIFEVGDKVVYGEGIWRKNLVVESIQQGINYARITALEPSQVHECQPYIYVFFTQH